MRLCICQMKLKILNAITCTGIYIVFADNLCVRAMQLSFSHIPSNGKQALGLVGSSAPFPPSLGQALNCSACRRTRLQHPQAPWYLGKSKSVDGRRLAHRDGLGTSAVSYCLGEERCFYETVAPSPAQHTRAAPQSSITQNR